ncbi:hypothetical protein CU097_012641 [Rhizopus azygosporus]|uniref:Uncharacterized protein n=2 Tax=Rhizopus TaxID=4842 RepID=A0A367K5T5_RHIAZ|nr:hypothetical protein CU097_012641 [Rhizopus azygosporus]CEI99143.1 hypothetical protein RMCBS344292_13235 [Rhizopus microsporus]
MLMKIQSVFAIWAFLLASYVYCSDITFDYEYKQASGLFYYVDYQFYTSKGYSGSFNTKPYSIASDTGKWCSRDGIFCVQDKNVGSTSGEIILFYANQQKTYSKSQFHKSGSLNQIFDRWKD